MKKNFILRARYNGLLADDKSFYIIAVSAETVDEAKKIAKKDGYIRPRRVGIAYHKIDSIMGEKGITILFEEYKVQ